MPATSYLTMSAARSGLKVYRRGSYNEQRPHQCNNGLTPTSREKQLNLSSRDAWPLEIDTDKVETQQSMYPLAINSAMGA